MTQISVVIPTLNEEKYLLICLESLKNQTFRDFEIVVSDGGSTDRTCQIAKDYHAKVIVYKGSNVCLARDIGVRRASSEIIVGADADTFYPKDYLASIYQEFRTDKNLKAITGKVIFKDCPNWWLPWYYLAYLLLEVIYKLTGIIIYAPALNLAFRKKAFLTIGGYNTQLDFGGDELDILDRLKRTGKIIYKGYPVPITHSRRLKTGFFSFFFKHFIFYYTFNYFSARILGKAVIRAKPVR